MRPLPNPFSNVVRKARPVAFASLLWLVAAIAASGATLDEYRSRLDSSRRFVDQLLELVGNSEVGKRDVQRERELISRIRKDLPTTEKVEWQGGTVETSNQWLGTKLEAFQEEKDTSKCAVILTEINERLSAIGKKIDELQNPSADARTKDEDKQKLAEILRREEFQKPQEKEKSLFDKWLDDFLAWLARVFPRPGITPGTSMGFGSIGFVLQIVIYALVIGLIGFLIYKFAPFIAERFGSREKNEKKDRVILGERIASDDSADDLFAEAERLAREGNLRGAIRKGYIAILCELSDRKIIGLARHKTNRDYLRDVRTRTDLFENMTGLTGTFERNWYGLRPSEPDDWEDFRIRYRKTISSV